MHDSNASLRPPALSLVEVIFYIVIAGIVMSISVSSLTAARQRSTVLDTTENLMGLFQTARSKSLSNLEITFGSVDCTVSQFKVSFTPSTASTPATFNFHAVPSAMCSNSTLQLLESKQLHPSINFTTNLAANVSQLPFMSVGFVPPNATVEFYGDSDGDGDADLLSLTSATFILQTDDGRFTKIITLNSLTGIAEVD